MKMIIDTLVICHKWGQNVIKGMAQVGNVRVLAYEELDTWKAKEIDYKIIYIEDTLNMNEVLMKLQSKGVKVVNAQWKRY